MIKKQTDLLNLIRGSYDIIDESATSPEYFQITHLPDKLTAGKNIIKLRGSTALSIDSEVLIDIADAANNPIYYEAQDYLGDDGSIIITVYVYSDASPGDGYICIVGQTPNGTVKWERDITIACNARNASEIIFLSGSTPQVNIRETQKSYLNQTYTQGRIVDVSGTGIRLISPPTKKIALQPASTVLGQTRKGSPLWGKTVAPNPIIVRNQSLARSADLITLQPDTQPIIEVASGTFRFSSSMAGGTIEINSPIIDTIDGTITGSFTYKSAITKVLNEKQARVADAVDFIYKSSSIYDILPSAFTCSFLGNPALIGTENTQSYVDIRIENLSPAAGDVYKVRSYMKPLGTVGEYELINETVLDKQNVFIYTSSADYDRELGIFDSNTVYTTYYEDAAVVYDGNGNATAKNLEASVTSSKLINALNIRPSGSTSLTNREHLRLQLKSAYYNDYVKDGNYVVSFDAVGLSNENMQPSQSLIETNTVPDAWIDVYMSGSAFEDPPPYSIDRIDDIALGKYIGTVLLKNNQRVDDYELDFIPNKSGNGSPIFVIRSGEWHIGDIRVYTDMQTGFSPSYQRIVTPVPTLARNAEQEFKFQYYDYEGNEADFATNVFGVKFDGSNFYLEGGDNLLTGSLYIGSAVGKGLEQSGDDGGAIKSVGYRGFVSASAGSGSGFLLWSGSALETTNPGYYAGVGLELVNDSSSYFRYTTNPPKLDIRTSEFFLGSELAFLSGSGEHIEISSSNFHVEPDGDVFAENVTIRDTAKVDSFIYKNHVLTSSADPMLETYTKSGKTYYRLNMTGSSASVFLRFNFTLGYPIGEINMTGTGGAYGSWMVLEPASGDLYLQSNVNEGSGTSKNKIYYDPSNGDWARYSFANAATLSGTGYSNLYRVDTGDRAWMVRSFQDWKVQNSSAYNSGPVYFAQGIIGGSGASAVTASWAENAISASYAVSASHEIIYETSSSYANTATSASHAVTASYALNAGDLDDGSVQYVHNQSSTSTTWTVNHNLGKQYLAVSVYDSSNNYIIPQQIAATSTNVTTITFSSGQTGNAVVTLGAEADTYIHNQAVSSSTWTINHGLGNQYLAVSVYDGSDNYILPQQITATDTDTTTLTFSSPQIGNAVATIGSGPQAVSKWTSGSGDMIYRASDVQITGSLSISSYLNANSHITASGNISSSGALSTFGEVVHLEGTDPRLKLKAKGANHPGIEWHEDSTRKWILYSDPDASQGGNDNLTWKNASGTELMELDQDGMLYVSSKIIHLDDTDTYINFTDDDINFRVGDQNMIDLTSGSQSEITFNEAGIDIDFRVEGDSDTKLFFTDAGNDKVGIGTNSPGEKLEVVGNISASGFITASGFKGDGSGLTNVPSSGASGLWSGSAAKPTATGDVEISGSLIVSSSIAGSAPLFIVSGSTVGIGGQQFISTPLHGTPQLVLNGNNNDPVFAGYDPGWQVQFHIQNSFAGTEIGSYYSNIASTAGNNLSFTTYDITRMNIGKYGAINIGGPMPVASASKYLPSGSGLIITGSSLAPILRVGTGDSQFSAEQDLFIIDGRGTIKSTANHQITGHITASGNISSSGYFIGDGSQLTNVPSSGGDGASKTYVNTQAWFMG